MIKADRLRNIIESEDDDPRHLAIIAGGHPSTFYRGANFNDADLRGVDLRGFNLQAATFERTRVDRNTKVDKEFRSLVGTKRTRLRVTIPNDLNDRLRLVSVKLQTPGDEHLGDLVEEALFNKKIRSSIHQFFTNKLSQTASTKKKIKDVKSKFVVHGHQKILSSNVIGGGKTKIISSKIGHFYPVLIHPHVQSTHRVGGSFDETRRVAVTQQVLQTLKKLSASEKLDDVALVCSVALHYWLLYREGRL